MSRNIRLLLCLLLTSAVSTTAFPARKKPQQVQDLHYGEVLFHFYQKDYFTALTHLMVAQQQQLLPNHAQDAGLLQGGMLLSYGMSKEAEHQFQGALGPDTEQSVQNRIWYYLGKIAYQRGQYPRAHAALVRTGKIKDKQLAAEYRVLLANTDMALGNNESAAQALKKTRAPDGLEEYLRINRGIALLRAGDVEGGRKVLDKLGNTKTASEELRALRDRANLGLGYELLRAKQPRLARKYLNRVRLTGPFAQEALLGAGWADAEHGDYQNALTPWLELLERDGFDAPVMEARLAVPFAFDRLGDDQRAIHFYKTAIDSFNNEQKAIQTATESVESGLINKILAQVPDDLSGGWLHRNTELRDVPAAEYLTDILAGNEFQENLKNFRDLSFLDKQLGKWRDNITLLNDMVDARRLAYLQRSPQIRKRLDKEQAQQLQTQWHAYQDQLKNQLSSNDPLGLATSQELQQWHRLERIQKRLASLPDNARSHKAVARSKWLKGVLYWQIQANYKDRLWKVRKQLQKLQTPIQEALLQHQKVEQALANAEQGFNGYEERIRELQARIQSLRPQLQTARAKAGDALQKMALQALEQRRQRIASYRNQARYALARNYDQLAQRTGKQP